MALGIISESSPKRLGSSAAASQTLTNTSALRHFIKVRFNFLGLMSNAVRRVYTSLLLRNGLARAAQLKEPAVCE